MWRRCVRTVLAETNSSAAISGAVRLLGRNLKVTEQSREVVDSAMAGLGGNLLRRSVADVEAEIAAAETAQREAQREATKELRRGRREHGQEQIHAPVEQLKAKLPRHEKATIA